MALTFQDEEICNKVFQDVGEVIAYPGELFTILAILPGEKTYTEVKNAAGKILHYVIRKA